MSSTCARFSRAFVVQDTFADWSPHRTAPNRPKRVLAGEARTGHAS